MEITYCFLFLLIKIKLGSPKVLHLEAHNDVNGHEQSMRTFAASDYHENEIGHHPAKIDPNMGLWILKNKLEAIEVFEKALKQKLEADKKMNEQILHDNLEKLLHPKKVMSVVLVKDPPAVVHQDLDHDYHDEHEHFTPPPPPPPLPSAQPSDSQLPYDPYYGH